MPTLLLRGIRHRFQRLSPCHGQVAHVLRTLLPVAGKVLLLPAAPRLACVKPAASVHPEPGSNSSLYIFYLYSSSTILTSSSLKGIYALMYFVLPYTSHTFFQVCCLSLSLFQSTAAPLQALGGFRNGLQI